MSWKIEGRGAVVGGLVVAVAVAGGMAYATIPDASGVIHACVNNSTKALRLIDTARPTLSTGHCVNGETPLSWSQAGPAGVQGPPGPEGPQGGNRALARIFTDGSVGNGAVNIDSSMVVHVGPGQYCFYLPGGPVDDVIASIESGYAPAFIGVFPGAIPSAAADFCPGDESASVQVHNLTTFAGQDVTFDVIFN